MFLAGRTLSALDEVAQSIRDSGGQADTAQLDALDRAAVAAHAASVVHAAGGVDVVFNATSNDDLQGIPLAFA